MRIGAIDPSSAMGTRTFSVPGQFAPFLVIFLCLVPSQSALSVTNESTDWYRPALANRPRIPRSPPQTIASICDRLCNCTKEKEIFLNVVCEFTESTEYVLDDKVSVPDTARTFHFNLGTSARLHIRGPAFRRLNRISIDGGEAGGRQLVEFGARAFHGIRSPFPEINVKYARELYIRGHAFQGDFKLNVQGVEAVIVQADAFQNTSFVGNFSEIGNLRFEKNAFSGTKNSQIEILNSDVGLLERMDASMQEIKLQNCRIDAIRSNTFDVVSIKSIVLDNCEIGVLESNFTTNKLLSEYLGIIGCNIGTIQSNAIANSGFSRLQISGNRINKIEGGAISATAINIAILDNAIGSTEANWLTATDWSEVRITNNSFGQLASLNILGSGQLCKFDRNAITQWTEGSLNAMAAPCQFTDNVFSRGCTCNSDWLDKLAPSRKDLRATSYCQIESLHSCFNSSTFNVQSFHDFLCVDTPNLDCARTRTEKKVEAKFLDPDEFGKGAMKYETILYLTAALLGIILLVLLIIIVFRRGCHLKASEHPNHVPPTILPASTSIPPSADFLPQTINRSRQVFSGFERAVIDLALEKLRLRHPLVFDQVDKHIRSLMTEQLSETEKVMTIGEIVNLLDECDNIGDDFLPFTNLLYRHLEENQNADASDDDVQTVGDVLYAEPGLMHHQPTMTGTTRAGGGGGDTHIYAEPNSAQQPLLKTDYALPMDRNDQMANLYADPVESHTGPSTTRLVSPYAIGNQLGAPPNLPDVLSRTGVPKNPSTTPMLKTFGKSAVTDHQQPGHSRDAMPMYAIPVKGGNSSNNTMASGRQTLQRDSSLSSSNSGSCDSGGSDITCKIDDIVGVGAPK